MVCIVYTVVIFYQRYYSWKDMICCFVPDWCEYLSLWIGTKRVCSVFWVSGSCLDNVGNGYVLY